MIKYHDLWPSGVTNLVPKNLVMRNGKPSPVRPSTAEGGSGVRRASDVEAGIGANGSVRAMAFERDTFA